MSPATSAATASPGASPTASPTAAATASPTPTPTASPTPTPTASPTPTPTPTAGLATLGTYNIDSSKVFVAGISSGGGFAVQMHVAHSATFKGVAIYAGHIYYCAQDSQTVSLDDCGGQTLTQAQYTTFLGQSESYLDTQSAAGTIDNESNLHGQPVYLWSGTSDTTVAQAEMNTLQAEYQHYGANVTYDNTFPANHGWESPDGTVACGTLASPYMIVCNQGSTPYDSEQTWLTLFLGSLNPRNNGTLHGTLVNFGQTEFGAASNNGMDTNGYLFVPATCGVQQRCGLVLAFSGCSSTQADIQTKWVTEAGIDEWADSNNFVVLYPYTVNTSSNPSNSKGCWDWWGYDGANYSLKSGTQISIVYKMVQRIDPSAP